MLARMWSRATRRCERAVTIVVGRAPEQDHVRARARMIRRDAQSSTKRGSRLVIVEGVVLLERALHVGVGWRRRSGGTIGRQAKHDECCRHDHKRYRNNCRPTHARGCKATLALG